MASGSCAEPGQRPKSSGVWNHFRHDKIKEKHLKTCHTDAYKHFEAAEIEKTKGEVLLAS